MIARYEFIDAQKALYPVVLMCLWAAVSRSGFYDRCSRPASVTGAPPRAGAHGRERFRRLGRHLRLPAGARRAGPRAGGVQPGAGAGGDARARPVSVPAQTVPADHNDRRRRCDGAGPGGPRLHRRRAGTKLVGDITYIPTWHGWAYLATVIDCHTKACIGWAIADHMRTDLVVGALDMAARNYDLVEGCIFHSDRGTQYLSDQFAKDAAQLGIRRSVGRTGICDDNALAESFNAALKVERVNRTQYPTPPRRRDIVHTSNSVTIAADFTPHSAIGHHKKPTTTTPTVTTSFRQREQPINYMSEIRGQPRG